MWTRSIGVNAEDFLILTQSIAWFFSSKYRVCIHGKAKQYFLDYRCLIRFLLSNIFRREYGVLAEIEDMQLLQRSKHSKRSLSPNSSNSSEKENYDPNRQKKLKHGKKVMDKKKRRKQPDILTNKLKSSQDKL